MRGIRHRKGLLHGVDVPARRVPLDRYGLCGPGPVQADDAGVEAILRAGHGRRDDVPCRVRLHGGVGAGPRDEEPPEHLDRRLPLEHGVAPGRVHGSEGAVPALPHRDLLHLRLREPRLGAHRGPPPRLGPRHTHGPRRGEPRGRPALRGRARALCGLRRPHRQRRRDARAAHRGGRGPLGLLGVHRPAVRAAVAADRGLPAGARAALLARAPRRRCGGHVHPGAAPGLPGPLRGQRPRRRHGPPGGGRVVLDDALAGDRGA
mmetsp:Transcript_26237/g.74623  ORF Transcript_26237/g.74623 Transcript_26237/m.74623 type:complete len:262 (+) Transcript_26237:856-1641(+)